MATTRKKEKKWTAAEILSNYTTYVLEQEKKPKTVYGFAKAIKIPEEIFYQHFASLEVLEKEIFRTFFSNTVQLLGKSKEFDTYADRDKMLTLFFTFFEVLSLNRSYVLFSLSHENMPLKNLTQLSLLRKDFLIFVESIAKQKDEEKASKFLKKPSRLIAEGAWVQLLFLMKFWMKDTSAGFEQTDVAIEKSVHTVFDVFDHTPLDSIVDFGKFLYQQKTTLF